MLQVHHLERSRSQRVLWLLEELGVPYELVTYARDAKTLLAPPELKQVHPLGKSPVVVHNGRTLAESGAIIEYVVEHFDTGYRLSPPPEPIDAEERLRYRHWLHHAEGSAMPPLLLSLVFARIRGARVPFFARPIVRGVADKAMSGFVTPQLRTQFEYIDAELGARPWFAGSRFTAADIQMSYPLQAVVARSPLDLPNVRAFVARIVERPAYKRAVEAGGPFAVPGADRD